MLIADVKLTHQGCIDENILCSGCGYNLRQNRLDGSCPECGFSVARSVELYADWPRSSPEAMMRLRIGSWMMATGLAINIILAAIFVSAAGAWWRAIIHPIQMPLSLGALLLMGGSALVLCVPVPSLRQRRPWLHLIPLAMSTFWFTTTLIHILVTQRPVPHLIGVNTLDSLTQGVAFAFLMSHLLWAAYRATDGRISIGGAWAGIILVVVATAAVFTPFYRAIPSWPGLGSLVFWLITLLPMAFLVWFFVRLALAMSPARQATAAG